MGAQPLRVIGKGGQGGTSFGVRHLTDPQAQQLAYDMFVKDQLACGTIGNNLGRSRNIIEMWATQGDWVQLRRQFHADKKTALIDKYGDPVQRAQAIYSVCDRTLAALNAYSTTGQPQLPQLDTIADINHAVYRTITALNKDTGLDACLAE